MLFMIYNSLNVKGLDYSEQGKAFLSVCKAQDDSFRAHHKVSCFLCKGSISKMKVDSGSYNDLSIHTLVIPSLVVFF